jgi:hypothetical protein
MRDVSEGGCFFEVAAAVRAGQAVSVSFVITPLVACWADGRVLRAVEGRGFAVVFDDISESLGEFVATIGTILPERRRDFAAAIGSAEILVS